MKRNNISISYRVPQYCAEMSRFWVNGKIFCKEWDDLSSDLGYLVQCGKGKEALDKIKRIVRRNRKQRRRVTFGFYGKGNNRYFYTRELGAYHDDLEDKLRIYKLWKEYCLSRDCDLATTIITEGSITPDGKSKGKERESSDVVDLSRPIKLRYPYRKEIV